MVGTTRMSTVKANGEHDGRADCRRDRDDEMMPPSGKSMKLRVVPMSCVKANG